MSDPSTNPQNDSLGLPEGATDEGGLRAPPGLSPLGKAWWWFHFLILVKLARLRFIVILLAVGLVIVKWDTLKAYYEKWARSPVAETVEISDNEYWCPMHPTIVRDHPDKCPICGMPLSRRKKGDAHEDEGVPPGVSRVQLTPYRMALAGLQTSEIRYEPLNKEIKTVGFVEFDERKLARISARLPGKSRIDKLFVNFTGQMVRKGDPLALLYNPDLVTTVQNLLDARRTGNRQLESMTQNRLQLWGIEEDQIKDVLQSGQNITRLVIRAPIGGHVIKKYPVEGEYVEEGARLYDVADLSTVWIEGQVYEDDMAFLTEGMAVSATTRAFPGEAFRGKVAFIQPHLDASTRTLRVRFDMDNPEHELRPGMYATVKLAIPMTELDLLKKNLNGKWRDATMVDGLAHALFASGGMAAGQGIEPLLHAAVSRIAAAQALVLTVPESAVIDTGSRKLVYREAWPGVYDGLEVQLGPRSGGLYPVLRGLNAGDKVATAGSFLLDAETRLTGGVGSTFFGASGGPSSDRRSGSGEVRPSQEEDEVAKARAVLAKLSRVDRQLAEAQGFCPVLNTRLGAMGMPVKILLEGQSVFLCCTGCVEEARAHAGRTLARVAELKARTAGSTPAPAPKASPAPVSQKPRDPEIEANLAQLGPEDRRLAEAQKYCAVQRDNLLGKMSVPFKVVIQGEPVFLCCDGCEEEARAQPERTLARVRELRPNPK
jgi:Cu(I)/Ag(I) efflux system membrane fusion protein